MTETRPDQPEHDTRPTCVACGRQEPGTVCPRCRDQLGQAILSLPALVRRLETAIPPGQGGGEKIAAAKPGSRPPVSITALSLLAASPVRLAGPYRPGWTPDGADLPIPAWVDGWTRAWRLRLGHHRPALRRRPVLRPAAPEPAANATPEQRHAHAAGMAAWREALADPLADEFERRFGEPATGFVERCCSYLHTWWDHACDRPDLWPDLAGFIAGLRHCTNAARAALGERTAAVYLGKCPNERYDRDEDMTVTCGAPLWADPTTMDESEATRDDVVKCPRCRGSWSKRAGEWLRLALSIRAAWPDDPRLASRQAWESVA